MIWSLPLTPVTHILHALRQCLLEHASQGEATEGIVAEAHCYALQGRQIDCEQLFQSTTDCRTFRPRRPLSAAYKTVLYTADKGLPTWLSLSLHTHTLHMYIHMYCMYCMYVCTVCTVCMYVLYVLYVCMYCMYWCMYVLYVLYVLYVRMHVCM